MRQDNFENVQVGDIMIFTTYSFGECTRSVKKVEKVTKTRFVVNGVQFKKDDGRPYGTDRWFYPEVSYPKDGEIEEIRRENTIKNVYYKLKDIKISFSAREISVSF